MGIVQVVFVKKVKRPSGSGTWGAYVLATDEFGTWLHTPAGSLHYGVDGQDLAVCEVAGGSTGPGKPIVQLIPADGWWIATWYPPSAELQVSVDICTPADLVGQTFTYMDLELDPWRDAEGTVGTDDWDEFHAARGAGLISSVEAARAMQDTRAVEGLLRRRTEPFGSEGVARLAAAMQLALPPLVREPPSC